MLLKIDDDTREAVRALAARLDEVSDGALVNVDTDGGSLRAVVIAPDVAVLVQEAALTDRWKVAPLALHDRPTEPEPPPPPPPPGPNEVRDMSSGRLGRGRPPKPDAPPLRPRVPRDTDPKTAGPR